MYNESKKANILNVLSILREYSDENHKLSQRDIADLLHSHYGTDIDRRTVKACITALIDSGYDISYKEVVRGKDKSNENTVWTDFCLERDFTDGELRILIDSILCSKYLTPGFAKEIAGKLKNMGSKYFQNSSIRHNLMPNNISHNLIMIVEDIDRAISERRKISFLPNKWDYDCCMHPIDEKPVFLSPYRLVTSNNYYYVIGKEDGANCLSEYRVDCLSDITVTEHNAEPNTFDVPMYIAASPEMLGGKIITAEFQTVDDAVDKIIRHFGENAVIEATEHSDMGFGKVVLRAAEKDILSWAKANQETALLCSPAYLHDEIEKSKEKMVIANRYSQTVKYSRAVAHAQKTGHLEFCINNIRNRHEHEKLKNIKSVKLCAVTGTDCTFIKNYTDVEWLSVCDAKIGSGEYLRSLHKLHTLLLTETGIDNIDFVREMPMLSVLGIFEENIKDYSPLYELKNLQNLRIPRSIADRLDKKRLRKSSPHLLLYIGDPSDMPDDELIDFSESIYTTCRDTDEYPMNAFRHIYNSKSFTPDMSLISNPEFLKEADAYLHFLGKEVYDVLRLRFEKGMSIYEIAKELRLPAEIVLFDLQACQDRYSDLLDVFAMCSKDRKMPEHWAKVE